MTESNARVNATNILIELIKAERVPALNNAETMASHLTDIHKKLTEYFKGINS